MAGGRSAPGTDDNPAATGSVAIGPPRRTASFHRDAYDDDAGLEGVAGRTPVAIVACNADFDHRVDGKHRGKVLRCGEPLHHHAGLRGHHAPEHVGNLVERNPSVRAAVATARQAASLFHQGCPSNVCTAAIAGRGGGGAAGNRRGGAQIRSLKWSLSACSGPPTPPGVALARKLHAKRRVRRLELGAEPEPTAARPVSANGVSSP